MINLRPAQPQDAPIAAVLLSATVGKFGDELFGLGDHQRALKILSWHFKHPTNRFSHTFTTIAESEGKIAGLLLSFPAHQLFKYSLPVAQSMWRLYGFWDTLRFIRRTLPVLAVKEADPSEYLVSHLAVSAPFRRQGIGRELLLYADGLARKAKLSKCSLNVELGNEPARTLYLSQGFVVTEIHRSSTWKEQNLHSPGVEHLVKILS